MSTLNETRKISVINMVGPRVTFYHPEKKQEICSFCKYEEILKQIEIGIVYNKDDRKTLFINRNKKCSNCQRAI